MSLTPATVAEVRALCRRKLASLGHLRTDVSSADPVAAVAKASVAAPVAGAVGRATAAPAVTATAAGAGARGVAIATVPAARAAAASMTSTLEGGVERAAAEPGPPSPRRLSTDAIAMQTLRTLEARTMGTSKLPRPLFFAKHDSQKRQQVSLAEEVAEHVSRLETQRKVDAAFVGERDMLLEKAKAAEGRVASTSMARVAATASAVRATIDATRGAASKEKAETLAAERAVLGRQKMELDAAEAAARAARVAEKVVVAASIAEAARTKEMRDEARRKAVVDEAATLAGRVATPGEDRRAMFVKNVAVSLAG